MENLTTRATCQKPEMIDLDVELTEKGVWKSETAIEGPAASL